MKALYAILSLLVSLPAFAQGRSEKMVTRLRDEYARSVATVLGEVEYKGDQMVLHVSDVWKGDFVLIGASISIPRKGPLPDGVKEGAKESVLVFFFLQPSISSHGMYFFSESRLRTNPELSIADLRRALIESTKAVPSLIDVMKEKK